MIRLDGKGVLHGAVIAGVSLEASAEAGLAVAGSPVGAGGDVLVVSGGGGGELEEDDDSGVASSGVVGISELGSAPSDVVVDLDDVTVLVSLGLPGVSVVPLGGVGGERLGVDPVDLVQVAGGGVGISDDGAGEDVVSEEGVDATSGLSAGSVSVTPAPVDDEEAVSLLEAAEEVASAGLAGGVNVGVNLVGVLGEVSDNTGLVHVAGDASIGGSRDLPSELLDGSVGGVGRTRRGGTLRHRSCCWWTRGRS